jgi:ribose transport system permease protein
MKDLGKRLAHLCLSHSIVAVLILLSVAMALLSDKFFTTANWANVLNNLAVPGIVALGVALVVIAGGIDLSFSSMLAACAALAAWLQPHNFWLALIGPLVLGVALGAFNGLLVVKVGTNPLITTLGTQWLFLAALFIITGGGIVQGNTDGTFHLIANGRVAGVPFPILLLLLLAAAMWFLAAQTGLGKHIYAYGSNKEGLRLAGVNANAVYL